MRSLAFKIFLVSLLSTTAVAQYRVSGIVMSEKDNTAIKGCVVYLNDDKRSAITDNLGRFLFNNVSDGRYTLHFTSMEFNYLKVETEVANADQFVKAALSPREETLQEVVVSDLQSTFGFTRMRSVDNMGIYEGKKSEVIIPEQLSANLATPDQHVDQSGLYLNVHLK